MLTWIRRLLAPPVFVGDEDKTRAAWLLNIILWLLLARAAVFRIINWVEMSPAPRPSLYVPFVVLLLGMLLMLRWGYVRLASVLTVIGFWLSLTAIAVSYGGIHSTGFRNYIIPVLIAGLLLGRGAALAVTGLSIFTGFVMWRAASSGWMPPPSEPVTPPELLIAHAITLLLAAALVTLAISRIEEALARVRAELHERKRLEAAQRASQQQYESLVHSIDGIVWEANPKTFEFTFVSQQAEKILGYPVAQWLTDPNFWIEHVHADDRDWAIAFCVAATERKEDHQFDYRMIAAELRPSVLDDLGLADAIEWQAQEFQARTGIQCQCDFLLENLALSEEQATALFRIVQEALTNVLRHAQATRVAITLEEQAGEFVLTIRDNGKGITAQQQADPQALGLLGMRERAHLIGGATQISGLPGKGTVVTVRVPFSG